MEDKYMYGRVSRYFTDRGYGFICGEDNNSYFVHHSQLNNEYIERGYFVFFKPFSNDRSDFNAGNVLVIEVPDKKSNNTNKKHKSKQHSLSKHKSCNADRVVRPDKEFKRFIKKFMKEQETDSNENMQHERS
jgi:cold shock CspA family protein